MIIDHQLETVPMVLFAGIGDYYALSHMRPLALKSDYIMTRSEHARLESLSTFGFQWLSNRHSATEYFEKPSIW
jgi:hypothetical protein